ncbi:hypothetical protein MTR67_051269 [Solanum verrucosum]|uniref:Uncharacterized protein n=1 Tax=Solanum verrucosum TaxID=315347 RepID=A0AAF0V661_SOLVR|nr:hypothetical protein MTR67_051269 [Solanum verrucosum]
MLKKFLVMTPMHTINEESSQHFHIFISSSVLEALVMLYMSPDKAKKHVADESIHRFISSLTSTVLHMERYSECAQLILVFCKLLRRVVGLEDPLYRFCRSSIRDILEAVGIARCKKNVADELLALNDAFMLVREDVVVDLSPALLQQPFDSKSGEAVYAEKSFDDYQWIIEHKEVTNFKVRRHFTTRMLEEARVGNKEESYEMLIDKSELLEVSFEYTVVKDPALLLGDLLLQFKHEEATDLEC